MAVLAGADSVESCEFWGGAGASVWWERLHLFGVASFSLGVGAASSGARLHCCSAREQSHRFWANYHPLRPGFVLLFDLEVAWLFSGEEAASLHRMMFSCWPMNSNGAQISLADAREIHAKNNNRPGGS